MTLPDLGHAIIPHHLLQLYLQKDVTHRLILQTRPTLQRTGQAVGIRQLAVAAEVGKKHSP